jgi:hypothetical protein
MLLTHAFAQNVAAGLHQLYTYKFAAPCSKTVVASYVLSM